MTPRVIVFIGRADHPLAVAAIAAAGSCLVGIVANDGDGLVDYLSPEGATASAISRLRPTHGISAGYRSIIPQSVIDVFPNCIVNVHTGLLPYGRGAHPNAWAIALNEPAGVTLHLIDAGVDTGPWIVQESVAILPTDTAETLHRRLTEVAVSIVRHHVPLWIAGWPYPPQKQPFPFYPARKKADLDRRLELRAGEVTTTDAVIDMLRARTFPPHAGCPYVLDGKRYRVTVNITEETT